MDEERSYASDRHLGVRFVVVYDTVYMDNFTLRQSVGLQQRGREYFFQPRLKTFVLKTIIIL